MTLTTHPYAPQIRLLLRAALLVFVVTVVIGILNGTDLVEFGHQPLLTHVHTGTLGWITTSVFAASLWLFGAERGLGWRDTFARVLPGATVVAVVAYNLAFLTTSGLVRPLLGSFMFLVIAGWLAWIATALRGNILSVPRLGLLAAVTTAAFGGLLGVLLGVMLATGNKILPGDAYGSHPATMVIGFLIPAGMALAEWHLRPELLDVPATRAGRLQVLLPFVGGLCVTVGLLADSVPLVSLSLPFEIVGVGIMFFRLWPGIRRVEMGSGSSAVLAAPTPFWLVFNIGLLVYLIANYAEDFSQVPLGLLLGLDHAMFIGVMTNSLFAQARAAAGEHVRAAAVRVLGLAVNIGLAGFVVGLIAEEAILKRIFTTIMGLGLLHGVATLTIALGKKPVPSSGPSH
ncbi:MAG: hypothetical protein ACLGIB_01650 [Actinomycetota bacterium]